MNRSPLKPAPIVPLRDCRNCRVCDGCFKLNFMVWPCQCEQPVHESCLIEQIQNSIQERQSFNIYESCTCPKCNTEVYFNRDFKSKSVSFSDISMASKLVSIMLIVLLLFLSGLLAWKVYSIVQNKTNEKTDIFYVILIPLIIAFDAYLLYKYLHSVFMVNPYAE